MKKHTLFIALGLIGLSVLLHYVHVQIFHDPHHMLMFLMGDIAFIPLEVFLVSLVIDRFIEGREKRERMSKSNMLVGLFYQELGSRLLRTVAAADRDALSGDAGVNARWEEKDYKRFAAQLKAREYRLEASSLDFRLLNEIIGAKQQLIVNLITNPVLGEHESFTDSLISVFHLHEEMSQRSLDALAEEDMSHLKVDTERVYRNLAAGWVQYMAYLQKEYPFLFASAVKDNPFSA